MKKIIILILSILMLCSFGIAGCSDSDNGNDNNNATNNGTSADSFTEDNFIQIFNETPNYGTVSYTGTKGTGVTVTAIANSGYAIERFNVNGNDVGSNTITLSAGSFTEVVVMVKFTAVVPANVCTITTVKPLNGDNTAINYTGKVTFTDSLGASTVLEATNGTISNFNLSNGTYTVSVSDPNFLTKQITVSSSQNNYSLSFNYNVISAVGSIENNTWNGTAFDGTYDVSEAALGKVTSNNTTSKKHTYMYFNPNLGEIKYAEATFDIKPSKLDGLDIYGGFATGGVISPSPVGVQYAGLGSGCYVVRYVSNGVDNSTANQFAVRGINNFGGDWKMLPVKAVTSTKELYCKVKIGLFLDGTQAHMFYSVNGGALTHFKSINTANTRIEGIILYNNLNVEITDLMLYTESPINCSITSSVTGQTGKATVDVVNSITFGRSVPVHVAVQDGYLVNSVKVDGAVKTLTQSGNDYYFDFVANKISGPMQIVVDVVSASLQRDVTLTLKQTTNNILLGTKIPENISVTFKSTNAMVTAYVDANGIVKTKLLDGQYVVQPDGYSSFTITVNGGAISQEKTITLTKAFTNDTVSSTGGISESAFTTELYIAPAVANKAIYMEFNYHAPSSVTKETGGVFIRLSAKESAGVTWGGHYDPNKYNSNHWGLRFGEVWFGETLTQAQYNQFTSSSGLKIAVAVVNGKAYGLGATDDGQGLRIMCRLGNYTFAGVTGIYRNLASTLTNIKIATRIEDCPIIVKQIANMDETQISAYINSNFSYTGSNGSYTVTSDLTKAEIYSGVVPFAMTKNSKISFKLNYANMGSGTKIFPAIVMHAGKGVRSDGASVSFQFCCWEGKWSIKVGYGDAGLSSPANAAKPFEGKTTVSVEIKANATGYLAIYIEGTEFATTTLVSKVVGFEFWSRTDGTGYTNNGTTTGTKVTYSFSNFDVKV
ncbi:MAG: hypothetical protein J6V68_00200 [Clostridia bacterium]|nr:hypothetical protein [Clostridia bacterium]